MKALVIRTVAVLIVLTGVQPLWAQADSGTTSARMEDTTPQRLSDLDMKINPQLGISSFEYSEGAADSKSQLSGGVTAEFGGPMRKLETGLLILRTDSADISSSYLTIPMMAKLRLISYKAQSWYGKFGFMPAFEISSNRGNETNNIDVITSLGMGGRFLFNRKSDFIVEATYNRGLMDALRTSEQAYNQGFLVMAGMSFSL